MTSGASPELIEGVKQGKQGDMDKLMDMQAAEHFGGEWVQCSGQTKTWWENIDVGVEEARHCPSALHPNVMCKLRMDITPSHTAMPQWPHHLPTALVTGATLSKLKSGTGVSGLKSQLLQDPMGMADFFGDDAHVAAALGL